MIARCFLLRDLIASSITWKLSTSGTTNICSGIRQGQESACGWRVIRLTKSHEVISQCRFQMHSRPTCNPLVLESPLTDLLSWFGDEFNRESPSESPFGDAYSADECRSGF